MLVMEVTMLTAYSVFSKRSVNIGVIVKCSDTLFFFFIFSYRANILDICMCVLLDRYIIQVSHYYFF